jgi:hypothetical protein
VLELSFTEEVNRSEVRKSERVEANISDVSLAVWWGLKERKSLRLGTNLGGSTSCKR